MPWATPAHRRGPPESPCGAEGERGERESTEGEQGSHPLLPVGPISESRETLGQTQQPWLLMGFYILV